MMNKIDLQNLLQISWGRNMTFMNLWKYKIVLPKNFPQILQILNMGY